MDRDTMRLIRSMDPDGWETRQPSDTDRARFHRTVVDRFGPDAWERYQTNWDDREV